jgi:flagellar P-ring protein precursor FlgI
MRRPRLLLVRACLCLLVLPMFGEQSTVSRQEPRQVLVRDITTISGVRDNQLVGYGIVVGLKGTGDQQQTVFTVQTLANVLQRMGVQIPTASVQVKNVASAIVTATIPPFARPGTTIDITVSSIGDAKSLEGGVLMLTALHGPDGQVYAEAQGPLTLGGYVASQNGRSKMVNHATVGRVPAGALVERDTSIDLTRLNTLSFVLRDADFTAAHDIAEAINGSFGREVAKALDSRRVDVTVSQCGITSIPALISRVQNLEVSLHPPAKVVMNERTGTIVMGGDVKLSAVSVLHGDLTVEVTSTLLVSQPSPYSKGTTTIVPETQIHAEDAPARSIRLTQGADVEELINGLHAMGASARDIVAILQAIKAAGGLQAELEVL